MEEYISIKDLTFNYENKKIFDNINLSFSSGKCYVVSGLNGTGKSTLLKIIGGKILCKPNQISVKGYDPFRETICNTFITYVNNEWGMRSVAYCGYNVPLQSNIKVKEMSTHLKQLYPKRKQELLTILDIDEEWKLNCISEGQRKRVQLYLNLLQPFDVCLLDEITVNLDILVKYKLLNYLKKQAIQNNSCILYVTHIFDGLDDWYDSLVYVGREGLVDKIPKDIISKEGSIYKYLLSNFQDDSIYNENDRQQKSDEIILRNAGGYSDGVLINYKTSD